jgi:hypothetical protein
VRTGEEEAREVLDEVRPDEGRPEEEPERKVQEIREVDERHAKDGEPPPLLLRRVALACSGRATNRLVLDRRRDSLVAEAVA